MGELIQLSLSLQTRLGLYHAFYSELTFFCPFFERGKNLSCPSSLMNNLQVFAVASQRGDAFTKMTV